MNTKHPRKAIYFIVLSNMLALTVFLVSWQLEPPQLSDFASITFVIWLTLVIVSRHGGLFDFVDSKLSAGMGCVVEFAALIILPFPLFALSIVISCLVNIAFRLREKHPEPFTGPDFNASATIISGLLGYSIFREISGTSPDSELLFTIALLLEMLVFGITRIFLINTLISLDEGIAWKSAPVIKVNTVSSEGILLITGAILAITYLYNPYLILFLIVPALLLQNLLQKANSAELIYIDAKTGIPNYRHFDEKINELYKKSQKNNTSLSLIFGDMDFLRNINNTYGHSTGDTAIIAVGKVFKQNQKGKFTVARFGGEEFVMLLPETTKAEAFRHAEAIRKNVQSLDVRSEENDKVSLTISLGVATYPEDAADIHSLIKTADEALYEAKRKGRNVVSLYELGEAERFILATK